MKTKIEARVARRLAVSPKKETAGRSIDMHDSLDMLMAAYIKSKFHKGAGLWSVATKNVIPDVELKSLIKLHDKSENKPELEEQIKAALRNVYVIAGYNVNDEASTVFVRGEPSLVAKPKGEILSTILEYSSKIGPLKNVQVWDEVTAVITNGSTTYVIALDND